MTSFLYVFESSGGHGGQNKSIWESMVPWRACEGVCNISFPSSKGEALAQSVPDAATFSRSRPLPLPLPLFLQTALYKSITLGPVPVRTRSEPVVFCTPGLGQATNNENHDFPVPVRSRCRTRCFFRQPFTKASLWGLCPFEPVADPLSFVRLA